MYFFDGIADLKNHYLKSRAGRCQAGRCYHLYSKSKFDSFDDYLRAEILRVPLQVLLMSSCIYI